MAGSQETPRFSSPHTWHLLSEPKGSVRDSSIDLAIVVGTLLG
jgi:hypothetical protein